jgi:hypothetical protein
MALLVLRPPNLLQRLCFQKRQAVAARIHEFELLSRYVASGDLVMVRTCERAIRDSPKYRPADITIWEQFFLRALERR